MALVLVMVLLLWMLAGLLVFALLYDLPVPTLENFIPVVFLSGDSPVFVFSGILVGAVIAGFTFAISAITVPMLMDRDVNVMTAMHTSIEAVRVNWQAMTLWACLIVMFVGIGIMTFYIGLLVTMPLVGHATWHAYRDLVPAGLNAVNPMSHRPKSPEIRPTGPHPGASLPGHRQGFQGTDVDLRRGFGGPADRGRRYPVAGKTRLPASWRCGN